MKKHTYESQNTWHTFFAYPLFQILKKEYLQISKYLAQLFAHHLFQILKKNIYKSQNIWHILFIHPLFQILKKEYLQVSKHLAQFFTHPLFQILKKHTYESRNILFILIIIILKEPIYIKTIIQINKHKVKYIIIACIPILL